MSVAAIDIGTNSMRLLVLSETGEELARVVEVTGLGVGVDASGSFQASRVAETLDVLEGFGATIGALGVRKTAAVATSATRDAANGPAFVRDVAARIGVVPQIITGGREAVLSFAGATRGLGEEIFLVIDIGGGSTEFIRGPSQVDTAVNVDAVSLDAMSFDIGSVRLTDRVLVDRPASPAQVAAARAMVDSIIASVPRASGASVLGVAGTFTSLAAMSLGLGGYDRTMVDGAVLTAQDLEACIEYLSALSIEETARIPSLHPRRAPVILAGAVIASASLAAVGAASVTVREADLLDALASELLDRGSQSTGEPGAWVD